MRSTVGSISFAWGGWSPATWQDQGGQRGPGGNSSHTQDRRWAREPKVSEVSPRRRRAVIVDSGVNGGIEYELDWDAVPDALAEHVRYIQGGPDSPTALIDSTREIAASQADSLLPVLVDILGFNNPIAANLAVDALVQAGGRSVPFLIKGVGAFNYAVNAYALRALGRIGDPCVQEICDACARKAPIPNVRRAAILALASLRYTSEEHVRSASSAILSLLKDPDWSVRYAAVVAYERICGEQSMIAEEMEVLNSLLLGELDVAVKGRARLACERSARSSPMPA